MKALIIVDVQRDFCPGGALAVPQGDAVVPVINRLLPLYDFVVATRDWHPANHGSFAANNPGAAVGDTGVLAGRPQIFWPVHCVQGSAGADFHPDLDISGLDQEILKGQNPQVDSYSGFFDNGRAQATGLDAWLNAQGVTKVHLVGLATDYCVRWTALDALTLGYETWVITDACRAVNLSPEDGALALAEMAAAGAKVVESTDLLPVQPRENLP